MTRRSEFDRLKDVAKAASLGKFKQRLELLADIDAIGPTEAWLEGIPPGNPSLPAETSQMAAGGSYLTDRPRGWKRSLGHRASPSPYG